MVTTSDGHNTARDAAPTQPHPPAKSPFTLPQWREAVAGAFSGAFSRTVMAPVERVKLLKQLHSMRNTSGQPALSDGIVAENVSAWRVAINVYQQEGFMAFWRGNLPSALRVAGTAAINFTCMDYYKRVAVAPFFQERLLQRHMTTTAELERRRKLVTSFVSGGLAGATSTTLLYPFEFVRTRLAMDTGTRQSRQYTGMRDVLIRIYKSDGVFGFYQGYGIALSGGIFYRVMLLGGYDALKNDLLFRKQQKHQEQLQRSDNVRNSRSLLELSWIERIISAQVISLTAGTLSYPFDSVRRRMMMQAGVPRDERQYRNSIHCVRAILRKEGIRGFFLGLGPNIVRSIGGALLLVGYDSFRTLL